MFRRLGENIALGDFTSSQMMVNSWMKSPGHRTNILRNDFTETGIAVGKGVFNGREQWIGVQVFGRPA